MKRRNKFLFSIISALIIISTLSFISCKKGDGDNHANRIIPEIQQGRTQTNRAVESQQNALTNALAFQKALRNVARSITPAVVNIRAERIIQRPSAPQGQRNQRDFFKWFFRRQMPRRQFRGKAIGSGFIINKKGYIITNSHVVKNASKITVLLQNEREYRAKVIGIDPKTDIAVLKISGRSALPVTPLGDSDKIQVGDLAVAIGNPFGLRGTVTFGIISAKGRSQLNNANASLKNFIQTDVPINRGNSGGPLLNIRGQVIGVNTMIYSPTGGNIGIGFAIPINIVKNVVRQLIKKGRVDRGFIGALIQPLDEATATHFGIKKTDGVLVQSVQRNGPADKAGLKSGDVILEVNNKKIKNFGVLKRAISNVEPGQTITIKILRNGKRKIVKLKVGRAEVAASSSSLNRYYSGRGEEQVPDTNAGKTRSTWMGMSLSNPDSASSEDNDLNKLRRRRRTASAVIGVEVNEVVNDSPAANAGMKPGDIIISVNYKKIKNLAYMLKYIKANKTKKSFFMKIKRGSRVMFATILKNPQS